MKTKEKFNQEAVAYANSCSPIHSKLLIFPSILAALSVISLIFYTIYMHYEISFVITIYVIVSIAIFSLASVALKASNEIRKVATYVTAAFVVVEPVSAALIGTRTKINSLYTYAFSILAPTLILIAILTLFFYLRKEQTDFNKKLFHKGLLVCTIITIGICCGTTVLRYDSLFSSIAAIIAYLSPLSIFLPIDVLKRLLFRIVRILNIVLLFGLFVFYIDMLLSLYNVSFLNIGKHSQIYKLYSVLRYYILDPVYNAWVCTLFTEALFEILCPVVLLINISICNNQLAHFKITENDI